MRGHAEIVHAVRGHVEIVHAGREIVHAAWDVEIDMQ